MAVLTPGKQIASFGERIPTRLNIGLMLFFACFTTYMLRVNMSINILGMVKSTTATSTRATSIEANDTAAKVDIDYGPRYEWSANQQSLLLGAYFWGYLITSLPGGLLAEWLGGKTVVGYSMGISGLLAALTPYAAACGFWPTYAVRLMTGVLGGVLYPALHNLISKWSAPDERGKFISALLGGTFGTVATWPLAGLLMESFGWAYAFYVPAAIAIFITCIWLLVVYDSPAQHPRIAVEEKDYIEKALGDVISKKKSLPPFMSLIVSPQFLALAVLHYGNLWGLYFLITAAPKFMNEVLGFDLTHAGILASLPYLARMFSGFLFGAMGDFIRHSNLLTVTAIRKSFCLFSHIIPGLLLIGLAYVGNHPYYCVTIITISLGFNGASTLTNLQNSQDLAPNFAGTLYGIINFFGTTTGFLTPMVVAHFTQERNTIDEWNIIFIIAAVAYIVPAIVFILFGSGNVQKWNEPKKDESTKDVPQATRF